MVGRVPRSRWIGGSSLGSLTLLRWYAVHVLLQGRRVAHAGEGLVPPGTSRLDLVATNDVGIRRRLLRLAHPVPQLDEEAPPGVQERVGRAGAQSEEQQSCPDRKEPRPVRSQHHLVRTDLRKLQLFQLRGRLRMRKPSRRNWRRQGSGELQ